MTRSAPRSPTSRPPPTGATRCSTDDHERLVAWDASGDGPLVAGACPPRPASRPTAAAFLAFGTWLKPESAGRLDRAVETLREVRRSLSI